MGKTTWKTSGPPKKGDQLTVHISFRFFRVKLTLDLTKTIRLQLQICCGHSFGCDGNHESPGPPAVPGNGRGLRAVHRYCLVRSCVEHYLEVS